MLKLSLIHMICLAAALPGSELKAQSGDQQDSASPILWGVQVGAGYFNFRNSLYVEVGPDPPGNLSEDWYEFIFKPWASFEWDTEFGTWFGKASWVYAQRAGTLRKFQVVVPGLPISMISTWVGERAMPKTA